MMKLGQQYGPMGEQESGSHTALWRRYSEPIIFRTGADFHANSKQIDGPRCTVQTGISVCLTCVNSG